MAITILIILTVIILILIALFIVRLGTNADWIIAKMKCKRCKYFHCFYNNIRIIICKRTGGKLYRTPEDVAECEYFKEKNDL